MPALPDVTDLEGTGAIPISDDFRLAIGDLHRFIAFLLGTSGTALDARTALGVMASSDFVNYNNSVVTIDTTTALLDWNLNNGVLATLLMNGNKTFNLPTNIKNNNYTLIITQSAATAHTVTWNAGFDWGLYGAPDISALNSQTRVDLLCIGGVIRAFWTPYK
jgi:hypothetical protein